MGRKEAWSCRCCILLPLTVSAHQSVIRQAGRICTMLGGSVEQLWQTVLMSSCRAWGVAILATNAAAAATAKAAVPSAKGRAVLAREAGHYSPVTCAVLCCCSSRGGRFS